LRKVFIYEFIKEAKSNGLGVCYQFELASN